MVVNTQDDEPSNVVDLVKFKIEKELRKSPVGSAEYETLKEILQMYEEGIVVIKWTKDDIWVRMRDDVEVSPDGLDLSQLKEDLQRLGDELSELFPEDED